MRRGDHSAEQMRKSRGLASLAQDAPVEARPQGRLPGHATGRLVASDRRPRCSRRRLVVRQCVKGTVDLSPRHQLLLPAYLAHFASAGRLRTLGGVHDVGAVFDAALKQARLPE
jgi:hypothetical protein